MREIKFRAWSHDRNVMVPVRAVDWDENGRLISLNYPSGKLYPHDTFGDCVALMQYTGIKDKNGAEIYECDIIQFIPGVVIGVVTYSTQFAGYIIKGGGENSKDMRLNSSAFAECEVIGNIYENPELLK